MRIARKFLAGASGRVLLAASLLLSAPGHSAGEELRIAFVPIENPEKLISGARPAMRFLEREMGRKVRHFITLNYSAAVEAMISEKADVSFLPPLPYVLASRRAGVEAVLGEIYEGKPYYYSRIFARRDGGVKTLADLRGGTIAYVDPISSSGFMYPHDVFVRAGLVKGGPEKPEGGFFRRVYFAGGDQQAMEAVAGGFVDAAGVSQYALNLLPPERRGEIAAIAQSARIPSHGVVARRGLAPDVRRAFIEAMLKLNRPERRALRRALYGTDGYVRVGPAHYEPVAAMARKYGFLRE